MAQTASLNHAKTQINEATSVARVTTFSNFYDVDEVIGKYVLF